MSELPDDHCADCWNERTLRNPATGIYRSCPNCCTSCGHEGNGHYDDGSCRTQDCDRFGYPADVS